MPDGKPLSPAARAAAFSAAVCVGLALGALVMKAGPGWQLEQRQVVAIWLDAAMLFPGGFVVLWALFAWLDGRKR